MTARARITITLLDPPMPWPPAANHALAKKYKRIAVGPKADPFAIVVSRGIADADLVVAWLRECGYVITDDLGVLDIGHNITWRHARRSGLLDDQETR